MPRVDRLWLAAALAVASTPAWVGMLRADETAVDRLLQAMCRSPDSLAPSRDPRTIAATTLPSTSRSPTGAPRP